MLRHAVRLDARIGGHRWVETDQLGFPAGDALDGDEEEGEEDGEGWRNPLPRVSTQYQKVSPDPSVYVQTCERRGKQYNDPVIPSKDSELIQACDEVPSER